ncbi:hypothetical protein AJ79_00963 [Helicocarpus griseus UAMH5409]|uniref:Uncharacterized protein n=1 Tax=Helicocarpus griseus UAMH5409 TaxID=1447875 RepID=A0A2B7Y9Q5_9EURO|nr:hypothetical protein AJ79_00963 [Helicocarpus griseus UAMH5409]
MASICGTAAAKKLPPGSDPWLIEMGYELLGTIPESAPEAQHAEKSTSELQKQQSLPQTPGEGQYADNTYQIPGNKSRCGNMELNPAVRVGVKKDAFLAGLVRSWDNLMESRANH